ncbi:MAG: class II fructose-bisphosphate aldolase [Patescibacteria group bacterium]
MKLTLRNCLKEARVQGRAVGHFNISNIETFHAIYNTARKLNVPVIIGVSEGERDFFGVYEAAAIIKAARERDNFPIFLNADHTYSFDRVKQAIDAGYDAVIIDAAKLSFEDNVKLTSQCVEYAKSKKPFFGEKVLIEAELGYIGTSSKILDVIPEGVGLDPASLTSAADAKRFIDQTGVDLFAPSVGNVHGLIRGGNPALNIGRIGEISAAVKTPLVLHGASGISSADLSAAVDAGISIVHYNTELRVAFRDALKKSLAENPDEVAPYKITVGTIEAVSKVVEEKLRIMNRM